MFSGIIEALAEVKEIAPRGSGLQFTLQSDIAPEFKVDQSVAHNGVCLTVEEISQKLYKVTAVEETLRKSNIGSLQVGSLVNLERSLTLQTRLDGHMVQGHVDTTARCTAIKDVGQSWEMSFEFPPNLNALLVEKGSITLNGISLTIFNCGRNSFSVAVIPYTYRHTNLHTLQPGGTVNIEFDIIGKYITRWMEVYGKTSK